MPKKLSDGIVEEIISHASSNYGFYQKLANEMTRLSKDKKVKKVDQREWSRQHISVFFTKNTKRRVEPGWSTGMLIDKAFRNLLNEKREEHPTDRA